MNPRPRHAQRTAGAEAGGQFAPQCAPALDVKGLVNRLMTDAHRIISGKVERQPPGNLFRALRHRPLSVLPASRSACFHVTFGPLIFTPSGAVNAPESRSCA